MCVVRALYLAAMETMPPDGVLLFWGLVWAGALIIGGAVLIRLARARAKRRMDD